MDVLTDSAISTLARGPIRRNVTEFTSKIYRCDERKFPLDGSFSRKRSPFYPAARLWCFCTKFRGCLEEKQDVPRTRIKVHTCTCKFRRGIARMCRNSRIIGVLILTNFSSFSFFSPKLSRNKMNSWYKTIDSLVIFIVRWKSKGFIIRSIVPSFTFYICWLIFWN